jgi:hypothetical protein
MLLAISDRGYQMFRNENRRLDRLAMTTLTFQDGSRLSHGAIMNRKGNWQVDNVFAFSD